MTREFGRDGMEVMTDAEVKRLSGIAREARGDILTMTTLAGSGHPGGSMSSLEIFLTLYSQLNICKDNACSEDRDFVVVSHGHTSPGVYSVLGRLGFFNIDDAVAGFRLAGSPFEGHIERHIPGVEWSTGNLGQGLSAGCGFALSSKIKGINNLVFVAMGDGEQQKGQLTEARRFAKKHDLKNLFAVIDLNGLQISGAIEGVMHQNIKDNYKSDGWAVYECDGHDIPALFTTFRKAVQVGGPAVIIANTVMSKGVSFMENIAAYHGKTLTEEQLTKATAELGVENRLENYKKLRKNFAVAGQAHATHSPFPSIKLPALKTYPSDKKIDNRSAYGEALADVANANTGGAYLPIAVFDCDLASSVKTDGFAKIAPANFFQSGIQEHSTATTAGALSTTGILSVFSDFGVFGVDEVYNQQRLNDINSANVKIVCTHVGCDVGEDGKTHQCIDYIGLMRNLYGFRVVVPADGNQTYRAVAKELSTPGNTLVAMGRSVTPIITKADGTPFFGDDYSFEYGKVDVLREGSDVAILTYGVMTYRAIEISELLLKDGISAKVVNVSCPKALDAKGLGEFVKCRAFVTYEDHNVSTGLASILAGIMIETGTVRPLLKLGVSGYCVSGKPEDVFESIGLSPAGASKSIAKFCAEIKG